VDSSESVGGGTSESSGPKVKRLSDKERITSRERTYSKVGKSRKGDIIQYYRLVDQCEKGRYNGRQKCTYTPFSLILPTPIAFTGNKSCSLVFNVIIIRQPQFHVGKIYLVPRHNLCKDAFKLYYISNMVLYRK